MLRRPFHRFVNKHGVHTFSNDQLGLNEGDESTHYPVFMHLWATYLPGGTRAVPRSDAAQARRLSTTKNERKRQRRLDQATPHEADQTTSIASAGKLQTAPHCIDTMCELFAESLSDSDDDISHQNLSNALLRIVTSYCIGNTMESCLTEEELGRLSLSCHFAADCLCDNWYTPFEPGVNQ